MSYIVLTMMRCVTKKLLNKRFMSTISYVSDVHADYSHKVPKLLPIANNLILCGDIGNPINKNVDEFYKNIKQDHDNVYLVPGNHDYDCSPVYNIEKVNNHKPILQELCYKYGIVLMNNNTVNILPNTTLIGSTLWSYPVLPEKTINTFTKYETKKNNYIQHLKHHQQSIEYIQDNVQKNSKQNIIIATHYVPSFKMIEPKYEQLGVYRTSWFATNLEYLITKPITHWIAGHSHSKLHIKINDVECGINAHGYFTDGNEIVKPVLLTTKTTT